MMATPGRARGDWVSWLRLPQVEGTLGLARLPGLWPGSLPAELAAIQAAGASTLISLTEIQELRRTGSPDFGAAVARAGLQWHHLPIRDFGVPDAAFETAWSELGPALHRQLAAAERIVLHCYAGLGRTGLVAARILIEQGEPPERALSLVRAARPGAIQTRQQKAYLRRLGAANSGVSGRFLGGRG